MERKSYQIRKNVEIKFIKDKRVEGARISNMQKTLCKKANELSILCGIKIAIIIFSVGSQPFLFGNPDVESVVHQFLEAKQSTTSAFSVKKKKKVEENKAQEKFGKGNVTHHLSEDFELIDSKRLEKFNLEIEKLEDHLNKEIDLLNYVIHSEDPNFELKMNVTSSLTLLTNWLSL
ncbi:hypothetical protein BC332_13490 [Capsicum chinense]|nr:hypothetical protein BC332_13490 [Capsicum chinense]